jgi:ubiquinone/menaquinone biosynthesis methyltransferase
MFDRIAHGYDRANRWMSLGIDVKWRRDAVARMLPSELPPSSRAERAGGLVEGPARVLDLCAGTMDSSVEIHRQHPTATILAGDFAEQMLAEGRAKLVGDAAEKIEPRRMDAHDLPVGDAELDAIFCAFGVRNLSDLPRATAEQARCLRAGGVLTVLEFFRPTGALPRVMHAAYNRTLLPVIGWAATGDLDAYTYLPRSIGAFETVDAYRALLAEHGFARIEARALTFGMAWVVRAVKDGEA